MPHETSLIAILAGGFGLALVLGYAAARLKLPPLVGYLVAGIAIGPHTPGFVADTALAMQLAEIGVMLLMLGVGLHFSLADLLAVRRIALPGALLQMTVATALGGGFAIAWGWSPGAALVFGLSLSVASTVVLLRALEARGALETGPGRIAVGWLVVEDLAMVLALVLLPPLAPLLGGSAAAGVPGAAALPAGDGHGLAWTLAVTAAKVSAFVALMLVFGRRLFPKVLWLVTKTGSRELFTLCVVAAAIGVAFGAAKLFDVSFALGAFFAGMMMRESEYARRAADESLPLRDAFAVLFFVSVGMLFDPRVLIEQPLAVAVVVAIVLVGKTLAAIALVLALGHPLASALTVGAGLAQIGEFSFILAGLGVALGLLPPEGRDLVLAGALISIALNPLAFSLIGPLQAWARQRSPALRRFEERDDPLATLPAHVNPADMPGLVVVVGWGRVGRRVVERLRDAGAPVVVAERDRDRVEALRAAGVPAVAGDAADPAVLIQAHVARAKVLVVATPDTFGVRQMVETARTLNPGIDILVRARNAEEALLLEGEQLARAFVGERLLADALASQALGAARSTAAAEPAAREAAPAAPAA